MSVGSFINLLYLRFIQYFYSGVNQNQDQVTQTNQTTNTSNINSKRPRRNRTTRRRRNRYRRQRVDLNNNFIRAQIIFRARQITARDRDIARLAEQELIDAILQARQELEAVQNARTRNVRPIRPQTHTVTVDSVANASV